MKRVTGFFFVLFCSVTMAACTVTCPDGQDVRATDRNSLEAAAQYSDSSFNPLPLDVWTPNPRLEHFLRATLQNGGIDSLAKYGMQCTPSSQDTGCKDCFACAKTFRDLRLGLSTGLPIYVESSTCEDYGEIMMRAEIGPGSKVAAMTYWRPTPQARRAYIR